MEDYDIDDYGISEIFDRIEKELTESMMRNFDKHRAEEDEKGINWSQWQVEQLAALEQYKRHNAKKYKREFTDINKKIDGLIKFYRKEGNNAQEVQILEALKKGLNATKSSDAMIGKFFKLNDRKIDALIESLTNDFERCEVAMLRRANDQYRKIIFASQMYASMGGTYEKAVDMAAKDFLRAGINNVEYKNGARHNMRDYADMAIRTACKRAYLTGEGEKRKEWGETLVIMNKRGNPCPKCFPWVGLILIDDVWSGGTPDDGPYKLMSTAISEGLYHPRCKDSHSTYFSGITTVDEKTIEDSKRIKEDYEKEQKINYYRRQQEKCERIAEYSLDEDNKRMYQARAEAWEEKAEELIAEDIDYMSNSFRPQYDATAPIICNSIGKKEIIEVYKVINSKFNIVTDVNNRRNKAVRLTEKQLRKIKEMLPEGYEMPQIAVIDFQKHNLREDAIGGYDNITGILYLNSKYDTLEKISNYVNKNKGRFANTSEYAPYLHELGHKYYYDSIKELAKKKNCDYNRAKEIIDTRIADYIHHNLNSNNKKVSSIISEYADIGYKSHNYTEVIAECFSVSQDNVAAREILELMRGDIL